MGYLFVDFNVNKVNPFYNYCSKCMLIETGNLGDLGDSQNAHIFGIYCSYRN